MLQAEMKNSIDFYKDSKDNLNLLIKERKSEGTLGPNRGAVALLRNMTYAVENELRVLCQLFDPILTGSAKDESDVLHVAICDSSDDSESDFEDDV